MTTQKSRVWELDALRGICILGMICVHLVFDLSRFGGMSFTLPGWFVFVRQYGHVLFVLISGICATFSSSTLKRGVTVFGAGLLISYVTFYMDKVIGITGVGIWFGILHMLGLCMILYPLFRKLPFWALAVIGAAFVDLFPIGLRAEGVFVGSDYFPIFPGLGWFLVGAALGKSVYRRRESLLPRVNADFCLLRFFRWVGKYSLFFYLLHQPVLFILVNLFA